MPEKKAKQTVTKNQDESKMYITKTLKRIKTYLIIYSYEKGESLIEIKNGRKNFDKVKQFLRIDDKDEGVKLMAEMKELHKKIDEMSGNKSNKDAQKLASDLIEHVIKHQGTYDATERTTKDDLYNGIKNFLENDKVKPDMEIIPQNIKIEYLLKAKSLWLPLKEALTKSEVYETNPESKAQTKELHRYLNFNKEQWNEKKAPITADKLLEMIVVKIFPKIYIIKLKNLQI